MPATATEIKPRCTHREAHPIRECPKCGAYMRSYRNGTLCDPCSRPPVDPDDHEAVFARISEMRDVRNRRKAFEALAEVMEQRGVAA